MKVVHVHKTRHLGQWKTTGRCTMGVNCPETSSIVVLECIKQRKENWSYRDCYVIFVCTKVLTKMPFSSVTALQQRMSETNE